MESAIWRVGVLLEASYLTQLKNNPMKLVKLDPGGLTSVSGVVNVCKIGSLNTYLYVNDYISPRAAGCTLRVVDQSAYGYPSVLTVALQGGVSVDREAILKHLGLTNKDLTIVTGVPQKGEPAILLASQHFMEHYGFFTREQVWFHLSTPVPLQDIMLTVLNPSVSAEDVVRHLYEEELLLVQQGFNYAVRHSEGDEVCTVQIEHCSPVLQGLVTKDTVITVLPGKSRLSTYRKRRSFRKVTKDTSSSQHENVMEKPDCIVEAVCVPSYKLPSHYIVLPKEIARKYNIFHCQNVWVQAHNPDSGRVTQLSDVSLPLHTDTEQGRSVAKRQHAAVVFLYEVEYELEQYVPPYMLGSEYNTDAMTVAYLHPELLFFLFPETLCASRHYFINIQRMKNSLPKIKTLSVSAVVCPEAREQEQIPEQESDSALKNHFEGRSVCLCVDEVFKVSSQNNSALYYKVASLGSSGEMAGVIDFGSSSSWECQVKPGRIHSYIPDVVPPSSLFSGPLLFDSISPAGLSEYTDKLFSYFLPAFKSMGSTKPLRSPTVLLHGPAGVGKHTVVQAVARRCRMHLFELNCQEFISDSTAAAETKLLHSLESALDCNPVVIILNNIHMLGRKISINEEPRICTQFEGYMSEIDELNSTSHFPTIVVGLTSKPTEVLSRVQTCFLQQLELCPPDQNQRLSMLKSLSDSYSLSSEVDLLKLARATVGSVFGDLVSIFSQAYDLAVNSIHQYCEDKGLCGKENLDVSGIVLTQQHLNTVLESLQTTQSDSIGAPKIPNVKWEDIGGLADAKKEILDTIQLPLQYPHLFGSNLRRSGVLLYGAPGTGKTLLAKAVATECSLTFLSVKGPEVINMYVGQSEENIRNVFAQARQCAPCVIFFDELDSIAPNRGRSGDSGGVMDRVVSQLLAELDGLHKSHDVFIIGATNRPDLIDPALLRPGRFDRLVYLGVNEDAAAKEKILKAITRKFQLASDVNLSDVAKRCPSILTGADLYALSSDAMMTALRRSIDVKGSDTELVIQQSDFLLALKYLKPSITPQELEKYKNIQVTMASK